MIRKLSRVGRRILLLVAFASTTAFPVFAGQQFPDYVLDTLANATVMVAVQTGDQNEMEINWGTGMIIAPGLLVTNAHVVNEKGPARITVHNRLMPPTPATVVAARYDSNEFETADVVDYIANTLAAKADISGVQPAAQQNNFDIAILSFAQPAGARLPSLAFSLQALRGESIVAAGFPGQSQTDIPVQTVSYQSVPRPPLVFSGGTISGVINKSPQIIIHNAKCTTGNSGGPVVNARGEIVGMQTWTSIPGSSSGYMSLAIGARDITGFLMQHGIQPVISGYGVSAPPSQPLYNAKPAVLSRVNRGDPDATALAGLFHYLGKYGFEKNDQAAVDYLQRAVNSGQYHPNAHLYKAGLAAVLLLSPVFWQPEYADSLLRSANSSEYVSEDSQHPDLHLLAYESALRMQGKAVGIPYDANRSLQLAERALKGGFALPFALAGYHYYFGDAYVGRDHSKALRYARQAASNNIPEGLSLLAHLYYDSDVIPKTAENQRIARRLAEEAAAKNDPWAYGLLATMFYDSGLWETREEALKFALLGTCFGNRMAVSCLGKMAWDSWLGNQGDFSQAVRAWAYVDWAERRGVRLGGYPLGRQGGLRSAEDVLSFFAMYPAERQRIVIEGRREQELLDARRGSRPRIPLSAGGVQRLPQQQHWQRLTERR